MFRSFTEPESGIDEDALPRDPMCLSSMRPLTKETDHLRHDITVRGVLLHGPRIALHVHENDRCAVSGDHLRHPARTTERANIVDEKRPSIESRASDFGFVGIDRDRDR